MAKTITFAVQKGGVSKTSTTAITAALLAMEGHRVLAVDLDSQGNLTSVLTKRNIYSDEFKGKTILEAIKKKDARPFIHDTQLDNVKILVANDLLVGLAKWLYTDDVGKTRHPLSILSDALVHIQEDFDFIVVDTPPNLGEQTQAALASADGTVILFEPAEWCYDAVKRFEEFVETLNEGTEFKINVIGILRNLTDVRRYDVQAYNERITNEYPDLVFETIIKRTAPAGRIGRFGLTAANPELKDALKQYKPFVEELLKRI